MRIFIKILTILGLGVILNSCFDDPNCINLKNDLIGVSFRKMFDGKEDTVGIFDIRVTGSDSAFNKLVFAKSVRLPLNPTASEQILDFDLLTGGGSIVVSYISKTQFESVDCGPRVILSDLAITQSTFDSVRLVNTAPQETVSVSNIDIYRCPITNNVKFQIRQLLADTVSFGAALEESLNGIVPTYLPLRFFANTSVSEVTLPLDLNSNSTTFVFDSKDNGLEQLSLSYSRQATTLFEVCGSQNFISGLQITSSDFDDFVIREDSIYDPPTTNVLLLRCPQTNLIEFRLKNSGAQGAPDVPFQITEVTADFTSQKFFQDSLTSVLVLPLDISKDQTDFNIEFEGGAKGISVGYMRTQQTFHKQCNQTLISTLSVIASDFTVAPLIVSDSIQFPTVQNIAIINN